LNVLMGVALPAGIPLGATLNTPVTTVINTAALNWHLGDTDTDAIMYGLIGRLHVASGLNGANLNGVIRAANAPDVLTWARTTAVGGLVCGAEDMTSDAMEDVANTPAGNFFRKCVNAFNVAMKWLIELSAAHQVRALKPENVNSYYASQNILNINGTQILNIINAFSMMIAKIMPIENARNMLQDTDWMRYHTNATSTPMLVQKAIDFVGEAIPGFWGEETVNAVTAAIAAPWNKALADAIPRKAVAATSAILYALKQRPMGWYQGDKAKAATPPSTYSAWLTITHKLQALIMNTDTINNAENFGQLVASVPGACMNC